jgi:hypothetical protein
MKTVGLLLSAALLAALSSAGTQHDAAKDADGPLPPLSSVCQGDEVLERLPPVLDGKPLGGNGVTAVPPAYAARALARAYRYDRGPDYKMRIIRPSRDIDYKIVRIRPNPHVDYKIRNFYPGGYDASAVPRAEGRRAIIIDPKRGGRGK